MDKRLGEKIEQKIDETLSNAGEIVSLTRSLEKLSQNKNSFAYGVVIGRLYNSFYYQCRRLLSRDPTEEEFAEFLKMIEVKQNDFLKKLSL